MVETVATLPHELSAPVAAPVEIVAGADDLDEFEDFLDSDDLQDIGDVATEPKKPELVEKPVEFLDPPAERLATSLFQADKTVDSRFALGLAEDDAEAILGAKLNDMSELFDSLVAHDEPDDEQVWNEAGTLIGGHPLAQKLARNLADTRKQAAKMEAGAMRERARAFVDFLEQKSHAAQILSEEASKSSRALQGGVREKLSGSISAKSRPRWETLRKRVQKAEKIWNKALRKYVGLLAKADQTEARARVARALADGYKPRTGVSQQIDAIQTSLKYFDDTRDSVKSAAVAAGRISGGEEASGSCRSIEEIQADLDALRLATMSVHERELGAAKEAIRTVAPQDLRARQIAQKASELQASGLVSEKRRLESELAEARAQSKKQSEITSSRALELLARESWDRAAAKIRRAADSLARESRKIDADERSMKIDAASEVRSAASDVHESARKHFDAVDATLRENLKGGSDAADAFLAQNLATLQESELAFGTELQTLASSGCGLMPQHIADIETKSR